MSLPRDVAGMLSALIAGIQSRLPRAHKAYVVETICRALHTLACGVLSSKPRAVAWALTALPDPWRATVARSRAWRTDTTPDPAIVPEVMRFVVWATTEGDLSPSDAS